MKDKDKRYEEDATVKNQEEPPGTQKKADEDDQVALLKEINTTLANDLDFYKKQLQINTDKMKLMNDMVVVAQETDRKFKEMQLDYENLKKRSTAAIQTAEEDGIIKAVKVILPTVDTFRRAITAITDTNTVEGLKMIYKQIMEAFAKMDIEEIPALGLQFDPEIHNAVMQVEDEDSESGTVVEVLQKGFIKGDKVIRYSQVKIAK